MPTTLDKVLQESHQIIKNGLQNLKDSFKPGKDELSPSSEQWATLEKAVDTYFDEQKQKLLKQTQPGKICQISAELGKPLLEYASK